MNARLKLNSAVVNGAVILAALVGWALGSWLVFLGVVALILFTAYHSGDIRTRSGPPPGSKSKNSSGSRPRKKN